MASVEVYPHRTLCSERSEGLVHSRWIRWRNPPPSGHRLDGCQPDRRRGSSLGRHGRPRPGAAADGHRGTPREVHRARGDRDRECGQPVRAHRLAQADHHGRRRRPAPHRAQTCTTAHSSDSSRSASRCAWPSPRAVELNSALVGRSVGSSTSSPGRSTTCARSPVASTRRSSPSGGLGPALRRSPAGPRSRWNSTVRIDDPPPEPDRGRRLLRRLRGTDEHHQALAARHTSHVARRTARRPACSCRFATTASEGPIPRAGRDWSGLRDRVRGHRRVDRGQESARGRDGDPRRPSAAPHLSSTLGRSAAQRPAGSVGDGPVTASPASPSVRFRRAPRATSGRSLHAWRTRRRRTPLRTR